MSLFLLLLICHICFGSKDKRTDDNEKMQDFTTASTPSYDSKGDCNLKDHLNLCKSETQNYPLSLKYHEKDNEKCVGLKKRKRKKDCPQCSNKLQKYNDKHELVDHDARYQSGVWCTKCFMNNVFPVWHCSKCDYDRCNDCNTNAVNSKRPKERVPNKQSDGFSDHENPKLGVCAIDSVRPPGSFKKHIAVQYLYLKFVHYKIPQIAITIRGKSRKDKKEAALDSDAIVDYFQRNYNFFARRVLNFPEQAPDAKRLRSLQECKSFKAAERLLQSLRIKKLESNSAYYRERSTTKRMVSNREPRKYINVNKRADVFSKNRKIDDKPQTYKGTNASGSKIFYLHLSDSCGKQYAWWVDTKSSKEEVEKLISENKLHVGVFALQSDVDFDTLKIDDIVIYFENGKGYYRDRSVRLTKIIEKQEYGIRGQILHGEEKGKYQKIHRNETKSKLMKVEYGFSKQDEKDYIEKFQIAAEKVPALQKAIEEKLFLLCYKAYDRRFCKYMLNKWREAHIHKYALNYEFENSNLFWAEAIARLVKWWDEILSIHKRIENILESMPMQENTEENLPEESIKHRMIWYEMLWLEIKAQAYGEKFQEFVTNKTNEAFHLKGRYDELATRNIQKLYDDVKGVFLNGSEDAEKNESQFSGPEKVYSMTKAVQKILRKNAKSSEAFEICTYNFDCENVNTAVIENNIKEYIKEAENLGVDKILDKRKTGYSDFVKGDGAFSTERIEQYEVVGIWTGDLYDLATDLHVFDYGGAKSHRMNYVYVFSIKNKNSKIKSELILDPNTIHGAVNDCRNIDNFLGSSYLSTDEERERFNLGWVVFYYKGIPYLAEVALDTIEAGKELFTYYGGKYEMSKCMKHNDDKENRKKIVGNTKNHVSRILKKIWIRSLGNLY